MSSVVDNTNGYANLDVFKEWKNNISASWNIENSENLEPRTGWKATASMMLQVCVLQKWN